MLYRELGTTGEKVSILGFGCMRLPLIGAASGGDRPAAAKASEIDYPAATELLHHAIQHGVNYVDTAWFYHAESFGQPGASEPFVGEALSGGWRDRVNLATKLPQQIVREADDMERFLEAQLERLQTDHLDFYLVHGLNGQAWDRMVGLGVTAFLDAARADGRIRYPAFSFHGQAPDFPRIIDAYDWAFGQLQYNYMDTEYQAGYSGLKYAADKGVGVVVMEPLKGGKLAKNLPPEMSAVYETSSVRRSPAEWALRYVWNEPGVSLLLSGMNSMDQLEENLRLADEGLPNSLSAEELATIARARTAMEARTRVDCTACNYCQPCPAAVDIPACFAALNAGAMWDDYNPWLTGYTQVRAKASACTECGQCEDICPQGLPDRKSVV
jgi:predicted aldo/keto reductase-like oxidoreductase